MQALLVSKSFTNCDNAAPSSIIRLCADNTTKNCQANGLQRDGLHAEPDLLYLPKSAKKMAAESLTLMCAGHQRYHVWTPELSCKREKNLDAVSWPDHAATDLSFKSKTCRQLCDLPDVSESSQAAVHSLGCIPAAVIREAAAWAPLLIICHDLRAEDLAHDQEGTWQNVIPLTVHLLACCL